MSMPNPARVASRFLFSSGLASELRSRFNDYLSGPLDSKGSSDLAKWFTGNFVFNVSSTPRGGKELKEIAKKILWILDNTTKWGAVQGENYRTVLEQDWKILSSNLDKFVALFSSEGGRDVPVSKTVSNRTYLNFIGMTSDRFDEYVDALEAVFAEVKGWRQRAFNGGLKVALAGPDHFRGTAGGVYKSAEDTMYVRATPKVLKRTRGTYGAFDYIIIHELGHRYEYKHRPLAMDFDKFEWVTTPYSRKDGEAFAELFALSNFNMTGTWGEKLAQFDAVMSGRGGAPA